MGKIDSLLKLIKQLKSDISQVNPAGDDVPIQYWQDKLLLSQLFEQAGDLYIEKGDFLLAVHAYLQGNETVNRESLNEKLYYRKTITANSLEFEKMESNDSETLFLLGLQHESGIGTPRNLNAGVYYYNQAASLGNARAQYHLGKLYELQKDETKAAEWFKRAAEQGYVLAQREYAVMCDLGHGVPSSPEKAIFWYSKAATQGNAQAQYALGYMYENGEHTAGESYIKAAELYRKAAEQGHPEAQSILAHFYKNGRGGLTQSDTDAIIWFRKAIDSRAEEAESELGEMYEDGSGPTDFDQAKLYRQDVRRDVENVVDMLTLCQVANPNHIETHYHAFMGIQESLPLEERSNQEFFALYRKNSTELVKVVVEDDLLKPLECCELLELLVSYAQKNNLAIDEKMLMWLGDYYFEQIPKHAKVPDEMNSDAQKACAAKAIHFFELIPVTSHHYDQAADSIVLIHWQFQDSDFDTLTQTYFTDKGKQPLFVQQLLASLETYAQFREIYVRENLHLYAANPDSKYARQVRALIYTEVNVQVITARLNAMTVNVDDDGDYIKALQKEIADLAKTTADIEASTTALLRPELRNSEFTPGLGMWQPSPSNPDRQETRAQHKRSREDDDDNDFKRRRL